MFRALNLLRVLLVANTVALNVYRADNFQHLVAGMLLVAAVVAWTGVCLVAYRTPRLRTPWLLAADLGVTVAALLLTPVVKGDGFSATVPGFWITCAMVAWAVHWRWLGGLTAAVVLVTTDVAIREQVTQTTYGNQLLLLVGGPVIGYLCGSLRQMTAERDRAQRAAAAAEERARLARAVHDGVLQVLALVQRRGRELGGEGARLGELAGEQEGALRALIRQQDTLAPSAARGRTGRTAPTANDTPPTDLAGALEELARRTPPRVRLVTPGVPVPLPADRAAELLAVVGACLANVAVHVGEDAPAWVLLEDLGDAVVLSVRDEGPGIPEGRLEAAAEQGRLGVAESIRGRVRDLGGTARLDTGPGGTEWEVTVPR